jgi:hypothetical protein
MHFFDLSIVPLSFSFRGRFKSTYPPINLKYPPMEVVKPSLLASKLSLTYTLIGSWCKLMSKMLLITIFKLLLLESYKMLGTFGKHYPFYQVDLWCSFFSLLLAWASWGASHHYWIIFRHKGRWPPRRYLLSTLRNHCASPQLRLSIPSGWYTHHGPYELDCPCLWPPFNPISLSWA